MKKELIVKNNLHPFESSPFSFMVDDTDVKKLTLIDRKTDEKLPVDMEKEGEQIRGNCILTLGAKEERRFEIISEETGDDKVELKEAV